MAETDNVLKRVLQLKMRALGEPSQVLALIRSSAPFYRAMGGGGFRVLQNVDDPAQIVVEIEYEANAALELNRQKVASNPMILTFLQGWRAILAGNADIYVYEDVTG
jgi:hypothetical protein